MNKKLLTVCIASILAASCATPRFGADISMGGASTRGLCQQLAVSRFEAENNIYNLFMPTGAARAEAAAIQTELKARHTDWPWPDIDAGKIRVGMTEDQAVCAWGPPHKVNRASYGDQWVYYRDRVTSQYLYFKDGILTAFN